MSTAFNNSVDWNRKIDNKNMIDSYPIYPEAPTAATNKRGGHYVQEEPIELSPPASPSIFTPNFADKRSYTTPYFKQEIFIPTPTLTPESSILRHTQDDNQVDQVILKRHSTLSSIHSQESSLRNTLQESPSAISLGRHHTTGHTLKSARQRMADKERLQLMRRSEEFQKELSARRKTFKRLSRLMDPAATADEDPVLMGTRISEGHQNYVLMYNMLTGIRIAVSRVTAKVDRPLTDEDFTAAHKLAFDVIGDELTPGAKYDFKFKDYSPWVFRHLREKFGVDPADYLVITNIFILLLL